MCVSVCVVTLASKLTVELHFSSSGMSCLHIFQLCKQVMFLGINLEKGSRGRRTLTIVPVEPSFGSASEAPSRASVLSPSALPLTARGGAWA